MVDSWIALAVIAAIAITSLCLVYRHELAAFPVTAKVRSRGVPNLTGAKFRWGPHERRAHIKAMTATNLIVCLLLLIWFGLAVLGPVLFIALFVWFNLFTVLFMFNWVYDNFLWQSRALKTWGLDPFPWDGNLHVWERGYGKMQTPDPFREDQGPAVRGPPKRTVKYGIAFESQPDRWYTGPPLDGHIVVAPILPSAESVKARLARPRRKAPERPKRNAEGEAAEPRDDGEELQEAVGIGWWDGYQYDVPGIPHIYLLGQEGLSHYIADRHVRKLLDGLDPELRAEIYKQRPKQRWWSAVVFIEVPADEDRPAPRAPDSALLLENMDLRAQLEQVARDSEAIGSFHRRALNRMGGR